MQTIKLCHECDYQKLQNFFKHNWGKNYCLSYSKLLLDWQFLNNETENYNFVVAENKDTHEFDAIIGFIPTYHFDYKLKSNKEYWLTNWKVKPEYSNAGLALSILSFLFNGLDPNLVIGFGMSEMVKPIYKFLRYNMGKLNHYYIPNYSFKDFNLIQGLQPYLKNKIDNHITSVDYCDEFLSQVSFEDLNKFNKSLHLPQKSFNYFKNRYFEHPFYKYSLIKIFVGSIVKAFLTVRKIGIEKSFVIRIVDVFGDLTDITSIDRAIQPILNEQNAEYIDMYNYGLPVDTILKAGFSLKNNSYTTIPNYFEPLVLENIELEYAFKSKNTSNVLIFKGDSDQDRPNLID